MACRAAASPAAIRSAVTASPRAVCSSSTRSRSRSRRCRKSAMVARSSSTALSRARTVRGRTTLSFYQRFRSLRASSRGDKHPDNTIIADLPRPVLPADQALRGRLRCRPDSGELGIGHAAGAVADRKADVVRRRNPPSPNATRTRWRKDRRQGERRPVKVRLHGHGPWGKACSDRRGAEQRVYGEPLLSVVEHRGREASKNVKADEAPAARQRGCRLGTDRRKP